MQESREFYDARTGPPSLNVDPQNVNGDVSAPVSHRVPEIETIDGNDNTRGNPDAVSYTHLTLPTTPYV